MKTEIFRIRLLPAILAACTFLGASPAMADPYFDWVSIPGGARITGYKGTPPPNLVIPLNVDGVEVKAIGDNAFQNQDTITTLTLPTSLLTIRQNAFRDCDKIGSVFIPISVTVIGVGAFAACDGLASIDVDSTNANYTAKDGVLYDIGTSAGNATLTQYPAGRKENAFEIPKALASGEPVITVAECAFEESQNLLSMEFANNVATIAANAFRNARRLARVTFDSQVSSIGKEAFSFDGTGPLLFATFLGNSPASFGTAVFTGAATGFEVRYLQGLTGYSAPTWTPTPGQTYNSRTVQSTGGLTYRVIGSSVEILSPEPGAPAAVVIPSTIAGLPVRTISSSAFVGDINITSVQLATSLTTIGQDAFFGCSALDSVGLAPAGGELSIPANIASLGTGAFGGCPELQFIQVDGNNPAYTASNGVLFNKDLTQLIQCPTGYTAVTYEVPASVRGIAAQAFYGNQALVEVTIGIAVTSIGDEAFAQIPALYSAVFNGSWPSTSTFGQNVFAGTSPEFGIFYNLGATGFTSPTWEPTSGQTYKCTLISNGVGFEYSVSSNQVTITGYTGPGGTVTIPSSIDGVPVRVIKAGAFKDRQNITWVELPDSLSSIGDEAFANTRITGIDIPSGVYSIGNGTFRDNPSLSFITVGSSNPNYSAESGVLFNQAKTQLLLYPPGAGAIEYSIPTTVIELAEESFAYNKSLTSLEFPNNVTTIGKRAFYASERLSDVRFGTGIQFIGDEAFADPKGALNFVIFFGNAPAIGVDVFKGTSPTFEVRYLPGKTGFPAGSSGIWNGYTAVAVNFIDDFQISISNGKVEILGYSGTPRGMRSWFNTLPTPNTYVATTGDLDRPAIIPVSRPNGYLAYVIDTQLIWQKTGTYQSGTGPAATTLNTWAIYSNSGARLTSALQVGRVIVEQDGTRRIFYQKVAEPSSSEANWIEVDFQIPDTIASLPVDSIAPNAFANNPFLRSVVLPFSVTKVGENAFYNCDAFGLFQLNGFQAGVFLPAALTELGDGAFAGCANLMSFYADTLNPKFAVYDGVLFNKTATALYQFPGGKRETTFTVPLYVTGIAPRAFEGNEYLISVNFPNTITTIGDYAFAGVVNLVTATLGDSVRSVGTGAFSGIPALGSVLFQGNAPSMGTGVFDGAAANFVVRFNAGRTGFTHPSWLGYPTSPLASWAAAIFPTTSGFRAMGTIEPSSLNNQLGGAISLAVTRSGVASGTVTMPDTNGLTTTYRFSGQFSDEGTLQAQIPRRGMVPLELDLALDMSQAPNFFVLLATSTISDGTNTSPVAAAMLPWSQNYQATEFGGQYNVGFDTDATDRAVIVNNRPAVSQGYGFASLTITAKTGAVRIAGVLSDGTPITASTSVLGDGSLPVWIPLYGRRGALTGDLFIDPSIDGRPTTADLLWTKPAGVPRSPDTYGFENVGLTAVAGSGLYEPSKIVLPPPPSNLTLSFFEGNWSVNPAKLIGGNFSQAFTVANNRITPVAPNPNNVRASWNLRTGWISGNFNNPFTPTVPQTNRLARWQGVILTQSGFKTRGLFILPNTATKPTYFLGGGVKN